MNQKQAYTVLVGKLLHPAHDVIIVGIAVIVPAELTNLLERIYDDQGGIRVLTQETGKLFIQSLAKLLGRNGKEQVFVLRRAEHPVQALL